MQKLDVAAARDVPAVQVDPSFFDVRPADRAESADGTLKSEQHLGDTIRVGLVDPRHRLSRAASFLPRQIRPTFAVEEPCGPRELVSIHDLTRSREHGTVKPSHVARSCDDTSPISATR